MRGRLQDNLTVITLILFCLILYLDSLWNIMLLDDFHTIRDNLYIKDFRYAPLFFKGLYSSEAIPRGMFRPLLLLSFSFNHFFSRLEPAGYHIISILLHFLNGIALYTLLKCLKKGIPFGLSLVVTLLFISHPINTETVNYLTCRSDLMVTFFVISAFILYLKERVFPALLLYALALMSKETGFVFPLLVLAYEFIIGRPNTASDKPKASKAVFFILLLAVSLSYWAYRGIIFGFKAGAVIPIGSPIRSLTANILTQAAVTLLYLKLFIWPHPLNIHHNLPAVKSLAHPQAVVSLAAIALMLVLIFALRRRKPLVSLGLAWYLICLLPKFYAVLNFPAMEHHFYLAGMGAYMALAGLAEKAYLKIRRQFVYVSACVIAVFAVLVWFRNYEWKSGYNLYRATVRDNPSSAVGHNNLGIEYMHMGLYDKAEGEFKKTILLSKDLGAQINPRGNLITIYRKQKKLKEAQQLVNEMLMIDQKDPFIYEAMGLIYLDMEEKERAEQAWKKGLSLNPLSSAIRMDLGLLYLKQGRLPEAEENFLKAIEFNPDIYLGYFSLGLVYERKGQEDSAIEAYEESIRLYPFYAPAHYSLGTLYANKADRRALWHLRQAIRLEPNFSEAHNNLAVLYASMEPAQTELARAHAQRALDLGYKVDERFLKIIHTFDGIQAPPLRTE